MPIVLDGGDWGEYDEVDVDALSRCIDLMRAENPGRREQIESLLTMEPWIEVAIFASYHVQKKNLGLGPWQEPPATCTEVDAEAYALLKRMRENGINKFEPDPTAALAKVEKET